jgi:hypothetical protein
MNSLIQFKQTIAQRNRERQDLFAQVEIITMKIMQSLVPRKSFHRNNIQSSLRYFARPGAAACALTVVTQPVSESADRFGVDRTLDQAEVAQE